MDLDLSTQPASTARTGTQALTLTNPSVLKIQTTGPGAVTLLQDGPSPGKTWTVSLYVHIREV